MKNWEKIETPDAVLEKSIEMIKLYDFWRLTIKREWGEYPVDIQIEKKEKKNGMGL